MTEKDIIEIAGKRLIRLSTFAVNIGLHIRTVQLWAKDNDLPVIRVGNQMLLDLDDIPAWLDRHKSKPAAYTLPKTTPSAQASSSSCESAHSRQT